MIEERSNINIKDMAFSELKKDGRVLFLPERDLATEDWVHMARLLTSSAQNKDELKKHLGTIAYLPILYPERMKNDLPTIAKLELIGEQIRNDSDIVRSGNDVKLLFPKLYDEIFLPVDFDETRQLAEMSIQSGDVSNLYPLSWMVLLHHTDKTDEFASISGLKRRLVQQMEKVRSSSYALGPHWEEFSINAAVVKMLYGKEEVHISNSEWLGMREHLDFLRSPSAADRSAQFFSLAANMTILAADDVRMTPDGTKLNKPLATMLLQESSQMPVRRRF
jgi:hypothetical protein